MTMTKKAGKRKSKKPKWSILTYAKIERRRKELGFSKARMATSLGVTNSTYHNWRRGTTIPHPNQQGLLLAKMQRLSPKEASSPATSRMRRPSAPVNGNGSALVDLELLDPPEVEVSASSNPCTNRRGRSVSAMSRIYAPTVPGIAAITVAFIESQDTPPSAGSIIELVRNLGSALT